MTAEIQNPREGTRDLIDHMLEQRKQMLVLLWELSKLNLSQADTNLRDLFEEFLEILVDYIASGHFGLYQRINEGKERRQAVIDTAKEIYPNIAETTEIAIEFTEKYDDVTADNFSEHLAKDLSLLAEKVTTRIEFEDQLIIAMLGTDYPIPLVEP